MNLDKLLDFIEAVFPEDLLEDNEHCCFWASAKKTPAFPQNEDKFARALKGDRELAMYFGTSTVRLTDEGELRNRLSQFAGLWCVVLDDIGTGEGAKCSPCCLPPSLWDGASYRIESSPDNYQLGYILEEPIRDVEAAREFVRLIYGAGEWDSGGAMPTKLVRFPAGVNLKDQYGEKGDRFRVSLTHMTDTVYTPDELLTLVDAGVGWQDILDGKSGKRDPRRGRGTTAYKGGAQMDLNGVIDPLLEWLNDRNMIVNERYPFVDIICPWCDEHSEGTGNTAGYSPLGWGEPQYQASRGFKCFHDHCRGRGAMEMIDWAMSMGGPAVAVSDPIAPMLTRYVLDLKTQSWVDIQSDTLHRLPDKGFKMQFTGDVWFPKPGTDKWAYASPYNLMLKNPGLLRVVGSCYEPGDDLVLDRDAGHFLNDCRVPWHGSGQILDNDVERFRDFIEYLLPENGEAEFLIRHLAMKAQNGKYRGPAIFMHTHIQGSGRGTLGRMLEVLWGVQNVRHPTMKQLTSGISGSGFNANLRGMWIVVPEAKDSDADGLKKNAGRYEEFKAFVEPSPVQITINEKYGGQWTETCYASVIVCSNHPDGMSTELTDRRVKRMRNTATRRPPEYFNELYTWLNEGEWVKSVWRYLLAYDCGDYTGTEPVLHTDAEDRMEILRDQSPMDITRELVFEYLDTHTGGLYMAKDVVDAIRTLAPMLGLADMRVDWEYFLPKHLAKGSRNISKPGGESLVLRVGGRTVRLRAINTEIGAETLAGWRGVPSNLSELYEGFSPDGIREHIKLRMEEIQ